MKLLSSSESSPFSSFSSCSSSTATTNTTTFDITNSKGANAGCIAGILRRILCYGGLPTYPSDHITRETKSLYETQNDKFKLKEKTESSATPNLVARLMGLESIPDADFVTAPNSLSRSRSMNSVECAAENRDPIQGHERRRVKSFREMPTFLELEDEKYLVLSFEGTSESKETRSKARKREKGHGSKEKKSGRTRSSENTEQVQQEKSRRVLKDLNGREILRNIISDKPKIETICDVLKSKESHCTSEDLSPVSVLDCGQFLADHKVLASVDDSVLAGSFPRRKDDCLTCDARKAKTIEGKCQGSKKKEGHSEEYFQILDEICRLTEAELVGSNWFRHKGTWNNHEGSAGIAADFESQIISQLIEEVVDEFANSPSLCSKPVRSTAFVD